MPALQCRHAGLRRDGGQIKNRVGVVVLANDFFRRDGAHRVQGHQHRLRPRQGLQAVKQVMQTDLCLVFAGCVGALVVPGCPCRFARWQNRCVGMQHGFVGLVVNGTQGLPLLRSRLGQHAQSLV